MFTFNHFNFNVLDLERSVRFYHDALGLEPVRTKNAADGSFRLVFLGDGHSPFQLELTGLRGRTQPYDLGEGEFHLAFSVPDMDAAHAKHAAMGCICFENPGMGIYFIEDPDGYWIEIVPQQYRPHRRRNTSPVYFCIATTTRLASGFRYTMTRAPHSFLRGALCWPVCALSRPAATAGRCRARTPRTPYARRRRCPAP